MTKVNMTNPTLSIVSKHSRKFTALERLPHVKSAHYNSIGRPGYLEGTRVDLIDNVLTFAKKPIKRGHSKVYLLTGPAGTGKSTVTGEICRLLDEEKLLAGSFFFVRSGDGDLGTTKLVFPTIAYQIAALHPDFKPFIAEAAREFSKLPSGSQKAQIDSLITAPIEKARKKRPTAATEHPLIIVLDASDEAGELSGFFTLVKTIVYGGSSFRFVLTTRPEAYILHALREAGIVARSSRSDMEAIPRDTVDADIRRFLSAGFHQLQWRDQLLRAQPNAIVKLVEITERLLIFARTVIEHLDHKIAEVSLRRLAVLLLGAAGLTSIRALDQLYRTVLRNVYEEDAMELETVRARVIAVLAGLVILRDQVTTQILAPMMGIGEDAAVRTVEELRPIILCTGPDLRKDVIRPLHLTLRDFLMNEKRCVDKAFYIRSSRTSSSSG